MGLLDTEKEFFFLLILSTLFGVSIKRITLSWAIIEINFLIFLPLLRFNASFFNPNALRIKYFFTQALASIIFFRRILFLNMFRLHSFFFYTYVHLAYYGN